MANECIITVKGRDKGSTERDPAGRGNTTRPWRDQTRPLSQFIRGRFFPALAGRGKLLVDVACIVAAQAVALPACIAAFPQKLSLKRSQLEPEFAGKIGKDEVVYVQKGV